MFPGFHPSSEIHQPAAELHQLHGQPETRHNRRADVKDAIAARKVQKADREKLRRDRLNEQFAELGSAIDPDRPKNDKATILGDTIQMLKELTAEVKRLKNDEMSLTEEKRDIAQEKNELREEKATLKAEIDQLQSQYEQRVRTMFSWTAMDPTMMMGAPPFPYSVPVPHPGSTTVPDSHPTPLQGHAQTPLMAPPFVHVPVPPGTIPMHPSFQTYPFFGNRSTDGSNPYLAFPPYSSPINSHTHVERPSAQYPSSVQPLPGYLVQLQQHPGNRPQSTTGTSQSVGATISAQASGENLESQQEGKSTASDISNGHPTNNGPRSSSNHSGSRTDHMDANHIVLQLKTPGSMPEAPHRQSNQSSYASEEQEQMQNLQEVSSEVRKGKSSPSDDSSVRVGLKHAEKVCARGLSLCHCVHDASSSSHGNEDSVKTKSSQSSTGKE